jgi:N-methylhydantoinase B
VPVENESAAIDPISVAVARAGLMAVAQEVFTLFERTALLPLLYDAHDFGVSVFDDRLNLIADAPGIPEFVGSLDFALRSIVDHANAGRQLQADDVIISTHPFLTGNHPPDMSMVVPAFAGSELVGFCGLKAHMGDLGGKDSYPVDSMHMFEEGLLLPPVKLYSAGILDTAIAAIIETNSRMPRETIGNVLAGAGALRAGAQKLAGVFERFGKDTVRASVDQLLDQGEREVRSVISAIPDGVYTAEDWLDDNGIQSHRVELKCTVTVSGSDMNVDTTGSAQQQEGPFNSTLPMTTAACRLALKRLTTEDRIPTNSGEHRPLTVTAPEGTVFHASPPAATFEMALTAQRLGEMIHTALAPVAEGRIPSVSAGDATLVTGIMNTGSGGQTFLDVIAPIGYGASATEDGMSALLHFPLSGMRISSIEVTELTAPVLLVRNELCPDSGGPGRHRGGLGTISEWRSLGTGRANLYAEKQANFVADGLDGGHPANLRNLVTVNPGMRDEVRAGKVADVALNVGDVIIVQGGSGSGYGDPLERDAAAVLADVRDGYVSLAAARDAYGVVISDDMALNEEETRALRDETRTARSNGSPRTQRQSAGVFQQET